MTEQQIEEAVAQIESNRIWLESMQPELRNYVTNKNIPLHKRFAVWSKHCKKSDDNWILHEGQFGSVGKYVDDNPDEFSRYADYDWEYFLDRFEDGFADLRADPTNKWRLKVENYVGSLDEFKEQLIETNFGSFTYDW